MNRFECSGPQRKNAIKTFEIFIMKKMILQMKYFENTWKKENPMATIPNIEWANTAGSSSGIQVQFSSDNMIKKEMIDMMGTHIIAGLCTTNQNLTPHNFVFGSRYL